jgi:hypothetical protein
VDKFIYGADTETHRGKPMTLQFFSEDVACDDIYFVNEKNARDTFLKWCGQRKRDFEHVVYIHHLAFDLIELLWGSHAKLVSGGGEFEFRVGKWFISGVYGTPTFCRVSNGHDITVTLIDSFSYFRGSLAKGAELFCPDLPKLTRPAGIGEKLFTKRDSGFIDYAMRDAVVAFHMGKAIQAMHEEYDIPQSVSVADMAVKIFKRSYLHYRIPMTPRALTDAALLSYHGGKNNITVEPGWYDGVSSLDISSAYPDIMRNMPAFSNEKLYRRFTGTRLKQVPEYGVYCVSGSLVECDWPVLFSHGFKPLSGRISDVWVHGFELNEALRSGEFRPSGKVKGWMYDHERDHQAPAFRGFVDAFYAKKSSEKDPVKRYLVKLILNAPSGKLIQTRKRGACAYTDVDSGQTVTASELVAGGLFHPFMASTVTAHTRARIHRLEHKYKAIHTATDGIMTLKTPKAEGRGLGALTVEARNCSLLLVRNKCYVLYGTKAQALALCKAGEKPFASYAFKGKYILKYALHGFQGSVLELEKLAVSGRRKYKVNKPNTLKKALKEKLTPNEFVEREFTLKIGPLVLKT